MNTQQAAREDKNMMERTRKKAALTIAACIAASAFALAGCTPPDPAGSASTADEGKYIL